MRAGTDEQDPVFQTARQVAKVATAWHRARLHGVQHLPDGPALLIGNHGLFGWETLVFFYLVHRDTGQVPVGLADRTVFGPRPIRELLFKVGGVPGTRANAIAALRSGRWVVSYPGGAREVFKSPGQRYRLAWERSLGFARLALEAGVPVIPFAGLGVDETFVNLGHAPLMRSLLGRYAAPLALPVPLPVQLDFHFARAIPPRLARGDPHRLKALVKHAIERLLPPPSPEPHGHASPAAAAAIS